MKKNIFVTVAFVVFLLLSGCDSKINGGDGITLKFNMEKGSKLDYTANMNMSMKQTVMGTAMDVTSKIVMGYLFEVTSDSAGWKNIASTISKMSMDMNAGGMSVKFDSNNPNADTAGPMGVIAKIFGALKGGQFSFSMNEKGEVGKVWGLNEMMTKAANSVTTDDGEAMVQGIGQTFDEDNFRQNIQQSFAVYPGKIVKPGESWSKTMSLSNNGILMKAENTYTLESVSGDNAKIKLVSKITSGDGTAMAGMQVDMNGTMDGKMNYDIPSGAPMDGSMNMKMDMKVHSQGQEVPMSMDMKMTITGKKI